MLRCYPRTAMCVGASATMLFGSAANNAVAQQAVPSQFTPQTLRPASAPNTVVLPGLSPMAPPGGNSALAVQISDVSVTDAFPELVAASQAVIAKIRGRRISVAEIYALASELEQLYGNAGYPLVRVVVPPQHLVDRGPLRLVVVDGFIETIDVDRVPAKARQIVAKRTAGLVGRRHLKLADIERSLLIA